MVNVRRPHTVNIAVAGAVTNVNGVQVAGTGSNVSLDCRVEPNTIGAYVVAPNGDHVRYGFQIFCDELPVSVIVGSKVSSSDANLPSVFSNKSQLVIGLFRYSKEAILYL